MASNKKNISVRLTVNDLRRMKEISGRLEIKESELFRYAVKMATNQLMPLLDKELCGPDLLIALLDSGEDLLRYFEFDSHQLDRMVNAGLEPQLRVDREDVDLVAIACINTEYLASRLSEYYRTTVAAKEAVPYLRRFLQEKYGARSWRSAEVKTLVGAD